MKRSIKTPKKYARFNLDLMMKWFKETESTIGEGKLVWKNGDPFDYESPIRRLDTYVSIYETMITKLLKSSSYWRRRTMNLMNELAELRAEEEAE